MEPSTVADPVFITLTLQANAIVSNFTGVGEYIIVLPSSLNGRLPLTVSVGVLPDVLTGVSAARPRLSLDPDYLAMHLHDASALMAQPEVAARLPEAVTQAVGGLLCDAKQIPGLVYLLPQPASARFDFSNERPWLINTLLQLSLFLGGAVLGYRGFSSEELSGAAAADDGATVFASLVLTSLGAVGTLRAGSHAALPLDFVPYLEAIDMVLLDPNLLGAAGVSPENLDVVRLALHLRALILSLSALVSSVAWDPVNVDALLWCPTRPEAVNVSRPVYAAYNAWFRRARRQWAAEEAAQAAAAAAPAHASAPPPDLADPMLDIILTLGG